MSGGGLPSQQEDAGDTFEEVREDAAYQLEEDQFAAFMVVGIDDDGRLHDPQTAIDGDRIPGTMSKEQAAAALLMMAIQERAPDLTVAEMMRGYAGIDLEP